MLTGHAYLRAESMDQLIVEIQESRLGQKLNEVMQLSEGMRDLLSRMLQKDAKCRISVKEALDHKIFNLYNEFTMDLNLFHIDALLERQDFYGKDLQYDKFFVQMKVINNFSNVQIEERVNEY